MRQEAEAVQQEGMLQPAWANERAGQQEATKQPDGMPKGSDASRCCGTMRSHATTNWANGRQQHVKRCQHVEGERGRATTGDTSTSRSKQEVLAGKNESSTCSAAAAVEATAMQSLRQL